jgi:hypothetical protein
MKSFVVHDIVDIDKLLEEERNTSKDSGWKAVSKSDLVETWSKSEENQSVHLVKVRFRLLWDKII